MIIVDCSSHGPGSGVKPTKPAPSYAERQALRFPDPFIAVFNLHVNKAGTRALQEVKDLYPTSNRHLRRLLSMHRTGIMEIFQVKSTGPSRDFATRCFAYTNGLTLTRARALLRCIKPEQTTSPALAQ